MGRRINMYDNRVFGVEVSGYGLSNGCLDYRTLAEIVGDLILNNDIHGATGFDSWELVAGEDYWEEDGEIEYMDVYQEYIISERGYEFLRDHTDEIVYYNDELDVYLWGVTHFGTSWDYVLTNVELVKMD